MKKSFGKILPFVLGACMAFSSCGGGDGDAHTHVFDQKVRDCG